MIIGILGAGSWGSALANLLAGNGHDVTVWSIDEKEIEMLNTYREQRDRLPGVHLNETITFTTDLEQTIKGKKMIVCAVPSPFIRSTAKKIAPYITNDQLIVNVSKGIEEATLTPIVEIIESEIPGAKVAVLSGPSHAEEVGIGIPVSYHFDRVIDADCSVVGRNDHFIPFIGDASEQLQGGRVLEPGTGQAAVGSFALCQFTDHLHFCPGMR